MNDRPTKPTASDKSREPLLPGEIGRKEQRKMAARRDKDRSVWFGLGMFGLVGWSVAVPALIFLSIGIWLDEKYHDTISWTLSLLVIGVMLGCLNAWFWINREGHDD